MRAPLYSLKRELGEKILSEVNKRKNDRNALANLYADLVIRWGKTNIPFGLAQRANADPEFHRNWAKENSIGLIQWELLNRAHRVLNSYGGVLISSPPTSPPGK